MTWLLFALAILVIGAVAAVVIRRDPIDSWLGAGSVVVAAMLGSIPALQVLRDSSIVEQFRIPWPIPMGEFFIEIDPLTAWFLLPTLLLSALCAIYGVGYLKTWQGRRNLGPVWAFYCLLVLAMTLVLVARNGILFLFAWELMAVTSFFLVTFEHHTESVREAGWIYLVATHLGTAFLLVFFLLMSRETRSMDFTVWAASGVQPQSFAGLLFLLAVIGFGTKSGFMPLHVWLPEAHPAAPSHVSALMSGVMIKTGIYGLLRSLSFLGPPQMWWGWLLLAVGLGSGVIGIVYALAQHDLKRLLAYSSVENIGLITAAIGLALLGVASHQPLLAVLGFAAALMHVLNHALFKGLLFLGAGSVAHAAGTRELDRLGGLLKFMPRTGLLFFLGSVAICGLPPFNGFISELLLAGTSLSGIMAVPPQTAIAGVIALACLGVIGGLAAATFSKAFGIAFLGQPRTALEPTPHEAGPLMQAPMIVLAFGCVVSMLGASVLLKLLAPLCSQLTGLDFDGTLEVLRVPITVLTIVSICGLVLSAIAAFLFFVRGGLLAGRKIEAAGTWGCGYVLPGSRIQYTGSSFVQPITHLLRWLLGTRRQVESPEGLLPTRASFATNTPDLCHGNLYRPGFLKVNWGLSKLRGLQQGQVQLYVLYIALTLIILLAWKFR